MATTTSMSTTTTMTHSPAGNTDTGSTLTRVPSNPTDEAREHPGPLQAILARTRTSSRSPSRASSQDTAVNTSPPGPSQPPQPPHSSTTTSQRRNSLTSLFSRLTSSTTREETNNTMSGTESQPHHHPGLLDKVKGIYHQRPSSRDRNGFGEDRHSSRDNPALSPMDGERGREGRDVMVSTGRGGAGNMRASSLSRGGDQLTESEAEARARSKERSRERGALGGRGGAGNFRSASKSVEERARDDEEARLAAEEERLAQERRMAEESTHHHSYGRGGAGNVR